MGDDLLNTRFLAWGWRPLVEAGWTDYPARTKRFLDRDAFNVLELSFSRDFNGLPTATVTFAGYPVLVVMSDGWSYDVPNYRDEYGRHCVYQFFYSLEALPEDWFEVLETWGDTGVLERVDPGPIEEFAFLVARVVAEEFDDEVEEPEARDMKRT